MTQIAIVPPVRSALERIPRTPLAMEPTPLVRLRALEREIAPHGPRLLAKMDAYTGFGLGGNKVRKLEYELAPERLTGVTCLVTTGGPQSNHARVTAAVAAWLGLECILVLDGTAPERLTGNALLHRLFGARIEWVRDRGERKPAMERVAAEVRERGGQPLVVPLGASTPRGALGYLRSFLETELQLHELAVPRDGEIGRVTAFVASSSGGTLAGLHLGRALTPGLDLDLVAVSADTPSDELKATARKLASEAGAILGADTPLPHDHLHVTDAFVGPGYGIATDQGRRAARLFAERAGIVLDPTYTAKAAAGMIAWIEGRRIPQDQTVVFWHTGGHPSVLG